MTKNSDRKAAEAHRARLKRQRADQGRYRAKNRAKGRPEREDVAGAALRLLLTSTVKNPDRASGWTAAISGDLAGLKVPFDPAETAAVFGAMLERHREAMVLAARSGRTEERERDG